VRVRVRVRVRREPLRLLLGARARQLLGARRARRRRRRAALRAARHGRRPLLVLAGAAPATPPLPSARLAGRLTRGRREGRELRLDRVDRRGRLLLDLDHGEAHRGRHRHGGDLASPRRRRRRGDASAPSGLHVEWRARGGVGGALLARAPLLVAAAARLAPLAARALALLGWGRQALQGQAILVAEQAAHHRLGLVVGGEALATRPAAAPALARRRREPLGQGQLVLVLRQHGASALAPPLALGPAAWLGLGLRLRITLILTLTRWLSPLGGLGGGSGLCGAERRASRSPHLESSGLAWSG